MQYVSTRGDAPVLDFGGALLEGLALDGGLYVPDHWPSISSGQLSRFADLAYSDVAVEVLTPFVGDAIPTDDFADIVAASYATFRHDEVVPLVALAPGEHLAELHWGPTLSFKDVALQLIGRLFEYELGRRGERVTIVGATSGDTGSAAIEACRDRAGVQLVMLHPAGRVSEVQRLQMTSVDAANIHNVAIDGTFDDCQDLVKAMFSDRSFRDEMRLSAVNSINWARVAAQTVYYVAIAARLGAPERATSFCVPTGNFGNMLAAFIARRMGVPIDQLIIASNRNDILTRTHETGEMVIEGVEPSLSPAMDIQVSSNFERLLFELGGRDGARLGEQMRSFRSEDRLVVDDEVVAEFRRVFDAGRADDEEALATIAEVYATHGVLIDPHTAVGVAVGRRQRRSLEAPLVVMSTAHPAKFPDAVVRATGVEPKLPEFLSDLLERDEHYVTLPAELGAVESHVRAVAGR